MVLLLFSSVGYGADWKFYGESTDGEAFYYDTQSIWRGGYVVRVWEKTVYPKGWRTHSKNLWSNKIEEVEKGYTIEVGEYNCSEKEYRCLRHTEYTVGGDIIWPGVNYYPLPWKFIEPGTMGEALFNIVCNKNPEGKSVNLAANWKFLGTDVSGNNWFYDPQSVSRGQDTIEVWNKIVLSDKYKTDTIKESHNISDKGNLSFFVEKFEIDCSKNMNRQTATISYDSQGGFIYREDYPNEQFKEVVLGSTIDALVKVLCKKGEGGK